jgi:hypothetical protein
MQAERVEINPGPNSKEFPVSQAKDRQRKRENKRAKRSLSHKESVKQRNVSKLGVKKGFTFSKFSGVVGPMGGEIIDVESSGSLAIDTEEE